MCLLIIRTLVYIILLHHDCLSWGPSGPQNEEWVANPTNGFIYNRWLCQHKTNGFVTRRWRNDALLKINSYQMHSRYNVRVVANCSTSRLPKKNEPTTKLKRVSIHSTLLWKEPKLDNKCKKMQWTIPCIVAVLTTVNTLCVFLSLYFHITHLHIMINIFLDKVKVK